MTSRFLSAFVVLSVLASCSAADDPAPKATAPAKKTSTTKKANAKKDAPAKEAAKEKIKTEVATFGGGCFWCLEAVYERVPGVVNVVSGYSGGTYKKPNYEAVSSGTTGHAEVVQITYDPEKTSFETLLEVFFHCHNPTTLNEQGPDVGTQYRSIILYHDADQKLAALAMYKKSHRRPRLLRPDRVTELVPFKHLLPGREAPPGLLPPQHVRPVLPGGDRAEVAEAEFDQVIGRGGCNFHKATYANGNRDFPIPELLLGDPHPASRSLGGLLSTECR